MRFTDPGLTAERVAASYGISPQYLRALLNAEGTTLSDLLLGRRLEHMRRLLANPRFHARRISSLAFEAGFGDLSYFNRTFRRRYGMTPSELRAASAACDD